MIIAFEPNTVDLMNGIYRFFKEKKVINKEKSGVTFKTSGGDPYSFLGTTSVKSTPGVATGSQSGTWIMMKLPKKLFITHYSAATYNSNFFRNFKVEGSIDANSWHKIDDYTTNENDTMTENSKIYLYDVQHRGIYKYIKLTMYRTSRTDAYNAHIALTGFELFGSFSVDRCSSQRKSCIPYSCFTFIFALIS